MQFVYSRSVIRASLPGFLSVSACLFFLLGTGVDAGQIGNPEDPIQVGWIDSMNSKAYRDDLEMVLRKNLDIELVPYNLRSYADGRPDTIPEAYFDSLDAVIVSIEADKTFSYELGDSVTKFWESGKCVIVTMQSLHKPALTGAWKDKKLGCLLPSATAESPSSLSFVDLTWGEHDKDSPLLEGVNSFQGSFRGTKLQVADDCTLHASWSDGTPLVATHREGRRVDLNFYPVTTVSGMTFYSEETDGGQLLRNAVYWCVGGGQQGENNNEDQKEDASNDEL